MSKWKILRHVATIQKKSLTFDIVYKTVIICLFVYIWLLIDWIGIQNHNVFIFHLLKWFLPYFSVLILLSIFKKYRAVKFIQTGLFIPMAIILAVGPVLQSSFAILMVFMIICCLSSILVLIAPELLFGWVIENAAAVFVILTVSSIVVTVYGDKLIGYWHNIQDKDDKKKHKELSMIILDQSKTRWLIFAFYFVLLIVFTFASLNNTLLFSLKNIDIAILQSFATYVAFDRLITNWNTVKSKSKSVSK